MTNIVFYKIYTNLGVVKKPNRQNERNDGVYYGPDSILDTGFLRNFPDAKISEFRFSKNSDVEKDNFYKILARESLLCQDRILPQLTNADTLVAVGGDNSIVLPTLLSDISRFGSESLGIITFDTHGDIHLSLESPTGNFHGLYMRPFFDTFNILEIDRLVPDKLNGKDIIYFGNFDFEQEEINFMNKKNIRRFSSKEIKDTFEKVKMFLQKYLDTHAHIFINFDIDVFDESLVKATGIKSKNGLLENDMFPLLEIIGKHKSKTISLSEVNPEKEGIEETVQIARKVILALTK